MKKVILVLVAIFLMIGTMPVFADGDVDVEIICPSSVKVDTALKVTINFYNWDCSNSVQVGRVMKALIGNPEGSSLGGTLGGAGIWGPFNWTFFAPRTLGPATCDIYGNETPTSTTVTAKIIDLVPSTLSGTMAMAVVEAVTPSGESLGGGSCVVEVVP